MFAFYIKSYHGSVLSHLLLYLLLEALSCFGGDVAGLEEGDEVEVHPGVDEVGRTQEALGMVFLYSLS